MDKQIVVCLSNRMFISNKKERTTDMLDNSDESPNHNVQGKQTTQTGTHVGFHLQEL